MSADFWARALGVAFGVLAAAAAGSLVTSWGEPVLRTIARGLFVGVLLELAIQSWRHPSRRPRRFRDRLRRFLAVVADPDRHAEYAETTPQVPLPVALLDDWDVLARERKLLPAGALDADEAGAIEDFARVLEHLGPSLRALGELPATELPEQEPWRLLVAAAGRALQAQRSP